jgi:ankyrin repeat protein
MKRVACAQLRSLTLFLALIPAGYLHADTYQNPAEAAKAQDWTAVASLLKGGAKVNTALADGSTVLAWTVHWNQLETTRSLLGAGADPNLANDFGITPLYLACENRNFPIIDLLLRAGADPNAATWAGETVLMTCARTGSVDGVNALLTQGADIDATEPERGQTALMWAAAEQHAGVVEALIETGADIKARSRTVLLPPQMFSVVYSKYTYFPKTKGDFTALMMAAQAGHLESVKLLLAAGADVNESTPEYGSALVLAVVNGNEDVALYLLEQGADPNFTDGYGMTPLHWAVQEGLARLYGMPSRTDRFWIIPNSPRLIKALLDKGADPNARMKHDLPPYDIHRFARSRNNDIPQVRFAGVTPILFAAAIGDMEVINLLLEAGADPNIAGFESERVVASSGPGLTPLMAAAGVGRERGVGWSDKNNFIEAVKLLVKLGGDVNQVGPGGRTAIHGAAYAGDLEMIRLLADLGADLNAKDWYGQSAVSIASGDPGGFTNRVGPGGSSDNSIREEPPIQEEVVELLVQLGARPYDGPIADRSGL